MLKRTKVSLNKISTDAAIKLVRNALNRGVNVKEVYVDTVGKPETYQALLQNNFPGSGIQFTVSAKADSKFPVVSAASIVAKVTRDRAINNWIYVEDNEDNMFDNDFGCGYPSDPITKKWMARNCDSVFGYPSIVRFSWKTTTNIMKDHVKKIKWENYDDEEDEKNIRQPFIAKDFFKGNRAANVKAGIDIKPVAKKFNYFEKSNLTFTNINLFK